MEEKGKSAIVFSHPTDPLTHTTLSVGRVSRWASTFRDSAAPVHRGGPVTTAFATDLEYLLKEPIALYGFGHTHWSCDQMIGTTRVVSIQVGYPGEETRYRPEFVVTLSHTRCATSDKLILGKTFSPRVQPSRYVKACREVPERYWH